MGARLPLPPGYAHSAHSAPSSAFRRLRPRPSHPIPLPPPAPRYRQAQPIQLLTGPGLWGSASSRRPRPSAIGPAPPSPGAPLCPARSREARARSAAAGPAGGHRWGQQVARRPAAGGARRARCCGLSQWSARLRREAGAGRTGPRQPQKHNTWSRRCGVVARGCLRGETGQRSPQEARRAGRGPPQIRRGGARARVTADRFRGSGRGIGGPHRGLPEGLSASSPQLPDLGPLCRRCPPRAASPGQKEIHHEVGGLCEQHGVQLAWPSFGL